MTTYAAAVLTFQENPLTRHPKLSLRGLTILIAAPFIAVACSSAASDSPGAANSVAPVAASEAPIETTVPVAAADIWRDIELTDVATGETFTLASLEGEHVAIEPMAIWCTQCKIQADNVKAVHPQLVAAGVRYVSLGVEPNEDPASLANYAERRGYDWTFAQSPLEMSRALNDIFGPQILAVPSTPLIILDPSGEIVFQDFGIHSPENLVDLVAELEA